MPKVSVITISYNNAEGLSRTIKSVLEQDFTDYEYIIIDGGSSDKSKDIISAYSDQITYWVSEPDKGIYNAMNKGIQVAKGKYLHFLNSGDSYASSSVLSSIFNKPQQESFLRTIQICDYGRNQVRWTNLGHKDVTLYDMYVNTMLHQATFIQRDMFDKYGLYDEDLKIVSDWKFFLKAILGGEKTLYINIESVVFEMEGVSTNKSHGEQHLKERKEVLRELMPSNLVADYERLRQLEQDSYITELIKNNKLYTFVFKLVNNLHKRFK